jgi:Tfp pilus assembly protein PilP
MLRLFAALAFCACFAVVSGCGRDEPKKQKNFLQQYHEDTEKEVDDLEKPRK